MKPALQQFGKYSLTRRLAFGGMAEIFLASLQGAQGFQKKVVLKRILPQFGTDPQFVSMFIDEAVIAARLTHPNVVQIYDFGDVDGVYFIAMEYVDGADLRQLVRNAVTKGRLLLPAEVAALGEGICAGLSYAHNFADDDGTPLRIIHRDISPHNIMVSRSGEAKVTDFGIAKAEARATRTATGTIKGKVAYMAPEQARGEPIDKRCDQFAVGLVLWEALTGERMFRGDSDLEMIRQVVACDTRPPSDLRAGVPSELDAIIMRSLRREREHRYDDLTEMQQDLARFRFSLGESGAVQWGGMVNDLIPRVSSSGKHHGTKVLPKPAGDDGSDPSALAGEDRDPSNMPWESSDQHTAATTIATASEVPGKEPTRGSPALTVKSHTVGRRVSRVWWLGTGIVASAALVSLAVLAGGSTQLVETQVLEVPVASPTTDLTITSDPPGAHIVLDDAETGLSTPAVLPQQPRGQKLHLELRKGGYEPWSRTVALLLPEQLTSATLSPMTTVEEGGALTENSVGEKAKSRGRPKSTTKGVSDGYISLRSAGVWVDVYHRGKRLGTTPLRRVKVPAGRIRLKLVNRDEGIEQTVVYDVNAGEETRGSINPR